jgi:hypothetical protein
MFKKHTFLMIIVLGSLIGNSCDQSKINYGEALKNFETPLETAKPSCFWWWLNSLADKESISRDLEQFKSKGMGGVTLICSSNWPRDQYQIPVRGPEFLSKEWRELFKHAINETARLGLEVGVNFCVSGWTMGGPWITPEIRSFRVKLLSVVEDKDGVFLLVAEGESVPGPVLEIGNTNSRYTFSICAKDFNNQWSKKGAKSYHPMLVFVSEIKLLYHSWFRTGSAYTSNGIADFLKEVKTSLHATIDNVFFRAVSGFFFSRAFRVAGIL